MASPAPSESRSALEIGPLKGHFSRTIWSCKQGPSVVSQRSRKVIVHTNTYTGMFTAALVIITIIWKQPRCSSVGEWTSNWGACRIPSKAETKRAVKPQKDREEP